MGDFNIDILKITSHTAFDDFLNSLGSLFFHPQILQPEYTARITDHSETLIDNIFLNSIEHFVISGNVVYDLTDHLPNFVIFEKFSVLPSNVNMYRRDYSKLNELDLIDYFQHVNWQTVLHVSTYNDPYLKDIGHRFFYWLFLFTLVILIRICILFGMKIIRF